MISLFVNEFDKGYFPFVINMIKSFIDNNIARLSLIENPRSQFR